MEQIFKSLLETQGYEYIGIVNEDKNVWGYAKEGHFHFCQENLNDVDRSTLGLSGDVLVITYENEKLSIVEHEQNVQNYIIIDGSNNILKEDKKDFKQLIRINSKCIVLKKYDAYSHLWKDDNKSWISTDYAKYNNHIDQQVVIDEKLQNQYKLMDTVNQVYILASEEKIMIHNGIEHAEFDYCPVVWKHENGDYNFFKWISEDGDNKLHARTLSSGHLYDDELELYIRPQNNIEDITNIIYYSNNYLIVKYLRESYHGLRYCRDSVLVISYDNHNLWSHPIYFKRSGLRLAAFTNNILIREYGYEDENDNYCVEEVDLYDVNGTQLELNSYVDLYDYKRNKSHNYIFSKQNNGMFNQIERLYGVVCLSSKYARVVVPPIFESIEEIGYDLYKVKYGNFYNDKHHQFECTYSVEDGIIYSEVINIEYHNNFEGNTFATNTSNDVSVFRKNGKSGLLYYGKKVIDACLDEICGFDFCDKWIGERSKTFDIDELERKTNEYTPKGIVLKDKGKYGLFINSNNIIKPQYDSLRCILITGEEGEYIKETDSFKYKKYAYFEAAKDGKVQVISDKPEFNLISKDTYDSIEVDERYIHTALIKVYKDGKVGLIRSKTHRNIESSLFLPIIYDDLQIISYIDSYNKILFTSNGSYYIKNGDQLLNTKDYDYIKCNFELKCWVFKNKHNNEYIFYNFFGKLLKTRRDNDGNIILDEKSIFKVETEEFIIKEPEDDYDDADDNFDID